MEQKRAIAALAALAQDSRLQVFRLLVRAGSDGLPAGEIAGHLGVQPATLSFHLSQLSHAGLVESRREGRSIIYSADIGAMKGLMRFLLHDCCDGHPELCGILDPAEPAAACCPPAIKPKTL
ncbi:MAG TPA: metalloregulator ArsR/SmtB family transcription factor [Azospirillaceae bacterium]|nr:metalloregulator ArsR/SmtB family transcription factor [Azospirillaceae bacterium]